MSQVSVIIPTFNRRDVLERALNSVVRQSYTAWELVVVDDGSTDGTSEFLGEWVSRQRLTQAVRLLKTANGGVSRARNLGVQNSTAPWIAFLDSDDEWLPHKLFTQMPLTTRYDWIHGEEIWMRGGIRVNGMKKHAKSGGEIFDRCVEICCVSPSTTMISRELFTRMNGFREDFPVCEDYELWLRIAHRHKAGFVGEPVQIKYGGNPDQLSLNFPAMDYYRVKALIAFLPLKNVAENIVKRSEILLRGYFKYPNAEHRAQVENWRQLALNALTQVQSAHSAADRLPRSVDRLNL